jgi:hypothetical protein
LSCQRLHRSITPFTLIVTATHFFGSHHSRRQNALVALNTMTGVAAWLGVRRRIYGNWAIDSISSDCNSVFNVLIVDRVIARVPVMRDEIGCVNESQDKKCKSPAGPHYESSAAPFEVQKSGNSRAEDSC